MAINESHANFKAPSKVGVCARFYGNYLLEASKSGYDFCYTLSIISKYMLFHKPAYYKVVPILGALKTSRKGIFPMTQLFKNTSTQ